MADFRHALTTLRHDHPIFFWGTIALLVLLLSAAVVVGSRIPQYRQDAALLDQRMSETERQVRDQILNARQNRAQLAIALLQRELRLKSIDEKRVHLAISIEDSTLSLRHGPATLREVPVRIGADTVVHGPNGRTWRFVRALGERHLAEKQIDADYLIPEWVYVAQGQPVPPPDERRMKQGLGRYILRLDDGTEIYTQPESGPFADGVKPASFLVKEKDMRAIFDAIKVDTPVYIY